MTIRIMSLLFFGGFLNNLVSSGTGMIPTQQEQANLLLNVQEVFEQVKLLVKDEGKSTEDSVVTDVGLTVNRAQFTLTLLEDLTLDRLSCNSNSVCMLESKPKIKQLAKEGAEALELCTLKAAQDISLSSNRLSNITDSAIDHGQTLLDALGICSRKSGLGVIACYKNIIATDVIPVKRTLLSAMEGHRAGHEQAIVIRKDASVCVDNIIMKYRRKIADELKTALSCV